MSEIGDGALGVGVEDIIVGAGVSESGLGLRRLGCGRRDERSCLRCGWAASSYDDDDCSDSQECLGYRLHGHHSAPLRSTNMRSEFIVGYL